MVQLYSYQQVLSEIEGEMTPFIDDGYTLRVVVGDGKNIPCLEFAYRVPRGSELQRYQYGLLDAGGDPEKAAEYQNAQMAERIVQWWVEGAGPHPKPEDFERLDGRVWSRVKGVIFDGLPPEKIIGRPEPKDQVTQAEEDAKN